MLRKLGQDFWKQLQWLKILSLERNGITGSGFIIPSKPTKKKDKYTKPC